MATDGLIEMNPYVYGKGLCRQKGRNDEDRQSGTGTVRKVYFVHAVKIVII